MTQPALSAGPRVRLLFVLGAAVAAAAVAPALTATPPPPAVSPDGVVSDAQRQLMERALATLAPVPASPPRPRWT